MARSQHMRWRVHILSIFFSTLATGVFAQNQFGMIPQVSLSFKLGDAWKVNTKLEGRQIFSQNPWPEGIKQSQFERLDADVIVTRNLDPLHAIGAGYLIRRSGGSFTHRLIQQYAITQRLPASRISHRFRTDQTFEKDEAVQYRLRYRLSLEKPLDGMELDPGEFYLKLSNEYLGILQEGKGNLEIRGLASLGYDLSDKNQIETGIDYRMEELIRPGITHKVFWTIGLYHSF